MLPDNYLIILSSFFGYKFPMLLILLFVAQSLLKTPRLKPFRTSVAKLMCPYISVFYDRKTLEFSTDPCKITGIAKLYCNAHVIFAVIIRFLLNVFSCHFSLCYVMGFYKLKTITTILMLVILKNY